MNKSIVPCVHSGSCVVLTLTALALAIDQTASQAQVNIRRPSKACAPFLPSVSTTSAPRLCKWGAQQGKLVWQETRWAAGPARLAQIVLIAWDRQVSRAGEATAAGWPAAPYRVSPGTNTLAML